jgi:ABC-type antimicrobial peptide transport system permease subunit
VLSLVHGIGRLKPDVTIEQARAELQPVALRIALRHPDGSHGRTCVVSLRERSSVLRGAGASDPLTLSVACLLLLAAASLATAYPTRRALRVDPADALRAE